MAAIERVIRSAQNAAASAATFARNDLLFTMSDNTRDAIAPLEGHGRIARFLVSRTSIRVA